LIESSTVTWPVGTSGANSCQRCKRAFTDIEIREGLLKWVDGWYFCTGCVELILKEWVSLHTPYKSAADPPPAA